MDRPPAQSLVPGAPTPGRRDMMFCHECHDEWYRDERGLMCPECGSDFTEIIEDDNDPRDVAHDDDDDDDDNESMPDVDAGPPPHHHHPFHEHNPWLHDDPEEADISDVQWRQVGPGRIAVTLNRTISPPTQGQSATASAMGTFASLLNTIMAGAGAGAGLAAGQRGQETREGQDQGQSQSQSQDGQDGQDAGQQGMPGVRTGSGTLPGGHRFTYSSNVRLIPRDTDRAANIYPQDDMNNFLVGILTSLGGEPAAHHHHHDDHDEDEQFLPHPFMNLFAQLMPGHGQAGDFVYSQEALDRIVSQLMEQTATSSAPGPASQRDIDGLARKGVTPEMLGPEGTAECSICMDSVAVGDQVTELPCHHWFHHACVAAWLSEHDTCPHCRKGIGSTAPSEEEGVTGEMPGAFGGGGGVAGEAEPVVVHESSSQGARGEPDRAGSTEESGGFGERLRRGLFGPPG